MRVGRREEVLFVVKKPGAQSEVSLAISLFEDERASLGQMQLANKKTEPNCDSHGAHRIFV